VKVRKVWRQKNRGIYGRGQGKEREALLLGRLGGRLLGSGIFALQVGDATLLFDHFIVLFAHGFIRIRCVGL
jgi:hypothetical protein